MRADRGVGLIARDGHLHGDVAGELDAADGGVLRAVPAGADRRPVEPLVGGVLDDVAEEALHRVGREDRRLGEAELQVVDHGRRVPHERARGRLDGRHTPREAGRHRLGTHAREAAEQPRDALVVEVPGHLPGEVRLHHPVDAVGVRSHPSQTAIRSKHQKAERIPIA